MAIRRSASGWMFLVLCTCLSQREVTSQTTPQVIPPANGSNATYDSNVDSNTTVASTPKSAVTAAPPQSKNTTVAATGTTEAPTEWTSHPPIKNCSVVSVHHVRDILKKYLLSGAKLVELDLTVKNYPANFLQQRLKGVFTPNHWIRSTGRQGRSLLVLEDNYDFMSLFFLSIGVYKMNVTLMDSPPRCLRWLNTTETLAVIRNVILNDFQPQEGGVDGSLSDNEHVCNRNIKDDDGTAKFPYVCCHKTPDLEVVCEEVKNDDWIDVLMAFIVITKVLVVLYSPSFLPGTFYRLKFVATEYIYHIPDNKPVKRLNMVVTQYPATYGNQDKVVKLSEVTGMEYFKTMVDTNMHLDRIYQVTFDRIRMSVKSRRLLGENYVPVGLIKMIYNNLIRCRIRRLKPLEPCCNTNILGRLNPGIKVIPWSKVMRTVAHLIVLLVIITPWIIRMSIYFNYEDTTLEAKKVAAAENGLSVSFHGSLTLYLSPLHGFFILMYLILAMDSLVYGVLSRPMKEKFKMVLRKCLRDMRERSRIAVFAWCTKLFVVPFEVFGVVGLLLFLPYLVLVLPLALPVAAFYLFPAINLTVRLFIHFFLFMCPSSITEKLERFSSKFSKVQSQLELHKVTAEETFETRQKMSTKDVILQVIIIALCLVSFWSITLFLMEVVSFFVEVIVYTLMGIIVNAGATLQYVSVIFLTIMYGRSSLNDVWALYLAYHKQIHSLLLGMKREEIDEIARKEATDQENTALRVLGEMAPREKRPDVSLIIKNGKPMWKTSNMLMFLDRQDTPYIPEKFFYDVITLNYCGAPGPLFMQYIYAFWSFSRILLFLFFVFIVVMAFGDAYSVSTTNQLLATVAGGFIPFIFRNVFSSASGTPSLHTDSVQFRVQLHMAINRFMQNWPIYDIIPIEFGEYNPRDSLVLNSTSVAGDPRSPSPNHMSPDEDGDEDGEGEGKGEEEGVGEERIDIDLVDEAGEFSEGGVDMVIDVSTPASRSRGPLGMQEAGSVSMLGADSFNRSAGSSGGGSARMYRPPRTPPVKERAIDV